MTKKRILGISIIFLILISFSFLQAQVSSEEEEEKIDNAYSCLADKVEGECSSLSLEEKTFSLLAINECKEEVIADSSNEECWPDGSCRLKETAQAVLALDSAGANTDDAQQWLLSQNRTPSDLIWYLQIESNEQTTCSIEYTGFSNTINIGEDKKISGDAGQCLSLAQGNYWLEISSSPFCHNQEFSISCDKDFFTTLLFRKQGSPIIHVSQEISSAAAAGTTTEKVESFCFREGGIGNPCNYEGSLWTALVLNSLEKDISSYLPYLITLAEDNQRFLPDAFLYFITADTEYSVSLLSKQKKINTQYYWKGSTATDMYYDTALALFPFKHETFLEKTNSKQWLLETQDTNGCWQDNTRNTAFILASIWPRDFFTGNGNGGNGLQDCESVGNYCVNKGSCEGQIFSDYYCGILSECCTVQTEQLTCAEQGGVTCSFNEVCRGGNLISSADTNNCCVDGGSCGIVTPVISECEEQGGTCKISCLSNEQQAFYSCEFGGDICCVFKTTSKKSYTWIWILLILIVLIVMGIIFRDKLRPIWFRIKSKFKGKKGPKSRYGRPPPRPPYRPMRRSMRRPMPERRVLPVSRQPTKPVRRRPSKSQTELDKVLKKLKDMSK
jgi:hypothetical protein